MQMKSYVSSLYPSAIHKQKCIVDVDKTLKSVVKRQIPFLIGGTITVTIMTYYYGFPFTIIVNSAIWWVISYLVNKYYWKSTGLNYFCVKLKKKKEKLKCILHAYCCLKL